MAEFTNPEKEALWRIWQALSFRFPIVSFLLLVGLFLKIFLKISLPIPIFFFVPLISFSALIYDFIFQRIKKPSFSTIINSYFLLLCFDAIVLTIIIYYLGGITWFGFVFYAFYFYPLFILLPRLYAILYFIYCTFLYSLLVLAQFLGFLPSQNIFSLPENLIQNQPFILTSLIITVAVLWSLGYFGDFSFRLLAEKIKTIQKVNRALEREKNSLAEKVKERTKELQEAKENLEKKVKERTLELEEKVSELERFYKAVVGRELKMRELKKELEKLKKKTKGKI